MERSSRAPPRVEPGAEVALPAPVTAELDRHLRRFTERGDEAFVFTSASGVPIEASNFRDRVWLPATRRAGLAGLRFHDLRHAARTLAAQTGATTKKLMARLGHSSPQAAMVYQHASLARDVVIAERLAQMAEAAGLTGCPPEQPTPPRTTTDSACRP